MLWGIILSLLTGIIWGGVGIVTSQIVKRDLDYLTYGIQCILLACLGGVVFDALAGRAGGSAAPVRRVDPSPHR